MKNTKKFLGVLLVFVMILSITTGCSSKNGNENSQKTKELTFCESWNFDGGFSVFQEPLMANGTFGLLYYIPNFYETLIKYENGKITPGLADKWEVSKDNMTYTFNLKKNIKFSDGEELTAEVVKKNFENVGKNLGTYNGFFGLTSTLIEKVTVIDKHTVSVKLSNPYYGALTDFTLPLPMGIMSPKAFNEDGSLSDSIKNATMGTGPYMYDGKKENDTYTFVKNPNYDRKKVDVETFKIKVIPDNDAKLLALRNNEIDMILVTNNLSYDSYNTLQKDKNFTGKTSETVIQTRYVGINSDIAPFNDISVRKAINHAINTESIRKNILGDVEKEATSILDKNLPYCNVDTESYSYSEQKAKELLEKAGWKDQDGDGIREKDGVKLSVNISCASEQAMLKDISEAIATDLKKVGFETKTSSSETMNHFKNVSEGKYQMAIGITYNIPMDPYRLVASFSKNPVMDNMTSKALTSMKNSDEAIRSLNAMTDEKEIQKVYNSIITALHDDAVLIPISRTVGMTTFNSSKIADYTFSFEPDYLDVSNIKTK